MLSIDFRCAESYDSLKCVYIFKYGHINVSVGKMQYIEDIYFFEVNTKYISLSVLNTSEFSRVRSTSDNSDVFNSRD